MSTICDHEYGHALTDAERDPSEEDHVLVTPVLYELCPDCEEKGYDRKLGGMNPPLKTASIIPRDFRDLERREGLAVTSVRPDQSIMDDIKVDSSSRYVPDKVLTQAPAYSTKALLPYRHRTGYSEASSSTTKPAKTLLQETFGFSAVELSKTNKPIMSADELRASERPKNDSASGFYDTPDGADSRARLEAITTAASAAYFQPLHARTAVPQEPPKSTFQSKTVAPPIGASDADLEDLISGITIRPVMNKPSSGTAILQSSSMLGYTAQSTSRSQATQAEELMSRGAAGPKDALPLYKTIAGPSEGRRGNLSLIPE
jgi:hypothetical protein